MGSAHDLAGRKLVQVAFSCRDLDRSRAFYRDTLGLPLMFEAGNMLFFQLDGMSLMVGREEKTDAAIGGAVIYFDAPDIEALGAALEARGIRFERPVETVQRTATHELKLRAFRDPDGNAIALMGMVPINPN
ncbi:MAG TPA: VOC family protein [Rhizomicrobium sp.]|jgi:catechol 2,3-dioxygenase-like lactoylglutathione lyase family enzyme|nr:VOC family protein [Rhizomicrobium sp.]